MSDCFIAGPEIVFGIKSLAIPHRKYKIWYPASSTLFFSSDLSSLFCSRKLVKADIATRPSAAGSVSLLLINADAMNGRMAITRRNKKEFDPEITALKASKLLVALRSSKDGTENDFLLEIISSDTRSGLVYLRNLGGQRKNFRALLSIHQSLISCDI